MSPHWDVQAGHRRILDGDYSFDDRLLTVFRRGDLIVESTRLEEYFNNELDDDPEYPDDGFRQTYVYATSVAVVRERLALLGFTYASVFDKWRSYFREHITGSELSSGSADWIARGFSGYKGGERLTRLMIDQMLRDAGPGFPLDSTDDLETELANLFNEVRQDLNDPREHLALLLRRRRGSTSVSLDVSDVVTEGWIEYDEDVIALVERRLRNEAMSSSPVIVVTEGSSDARLLRAALAASRPGIAEYFTFLDFDAFKSGGGTDQVVRIVKALAAADVTNRVLAVLDNDVAGRKASTELGKANLPDRFRVALLPEMPYLTDYPTVGPTGPATADVNGRAGSIEMCFGLDVLRRAAGDGSPPPVRWKSYDDKLSEYQGAVSGKSDIHDTILEAFVDPEFLTESDILEHASAMLSHLIEPILQPRPNLQFPAWIVETK